MTAPQSAPAERRLDLERSYPTTPDVLFDCFTDSERVVAWFGPRGVNCRTARLDVRPGGAYRIEMANPDDERFVVVGRYLEIDRPHRLQMTWAWENPADGTLGPETLVTLEFRPAGAWTVLHLTHTGFETDDAAVRHTEGWSSSFDCLADVTTAVAGEPR